MEWRDEGLVLSVRRHGETAAILDAFTPAHGRHAGVVPGGTSRKLMPALQPGNQVDLVWRARLGEHLGHFRCELTASRSALWADRRALAGLNAVCALLAWALPERDAHPQLYAATQSLFGLMAAAEDWPVDYLAWELLLLEELGYGLDLSACAVTGSPDDLAFVSPRTGRAVSRRGAGDWAGRLLPLPPCLTGTPPADIAEVLAALAVTGHFLEHRLGHDLARPALPPARQLLLSALARPAAGRE